MRMSEIDAFAATSGPGLASSLMIGASIAKALAIGFGKQYLAVNHLEGHLLSPFFGIGKDGENDIRPNVSLIVSGGHTMLVLVRGLTRSEEHTSELQSLRHLVCRLLLEKKKNVNEDKTTTPT